MTLKTGLVFAASLLVLGILALVVLLLMFVARHDLDLGNAIRVGFAGQPQTQTVAYAELTRYPVRWVRWHGNINHPALAEASGLETSATAAKTLWSLNDSGNSPTLYALAPNGTHIGEWHVAIPDQGDWEDLSAFTADGQQHLLIADTGDNFRWRRHLELLVVREPDSTRPASAPVPVERTIRFQFPNGPRDCEAIAVDSVNNDVILISKRAVPPEAYRVPLTAADAGAAELIGALEKIPQPDATDLYESPQYGPNRSMITALDIHDHRAVVATYKDAYLYERKTTWAEAFSGPPAHIPLPPLGQIETIAFANDGRSFYITNERSKGTDRAGIYEVGL